MDNVKATSHFAVGRVRSLSYRIDKVVDEQGLTRHMDFGEALVETTEAVGAPVDNGSMVMTDTFRVRFPVHAHSIRVEVDKEYLFTLAEEPAVDGWLKPELVGLGGRLAALEVRDGIVGELGLAVPRVIATAIERRVHRGE